MTPSGNRTAVAATDWGSSMNLSAVPGFARAVALPFAFLAASVAASPAVTLTDANTSGNPIHYTAGPYLVRTADLGCDDTLAPCDSTNLTIAVSPETAANNRVVVSVSWG